MWVYLWVYRRVLKLQGKKSPARNGRHIFSLSLLLWFFFCPRRRSDFVTRVTRVSPGTGMAESRAERAARANAKRKINHLKECKSLTVHQHYTRLRADGRHLLPYAHDTSGSGTSSAFHNREVCSVFFNTCSISTLFIQLQYFFIYVSIVVRLTFYLKICFLYIYLKFIFTCGL